MTDLKHIIKLSVYLLARFILVCMLGFMSIPFASYAPDILQPFLGVFYFAILLYFFIFTAWHEGVRDVNRVETGYLKQNYAKGFISSGIIWAMLCFFNILPLFFSPESKNIFVTVFVVIKAVISMAVVFSLQFFIPPIEDISQGVGGDPQRVLAGTIVFCGILLICAVGSGIGYIIGYKKIHIISPFINKIKNKWKD